MFRLCSVKKILQILDGLAKFVSATKRGAYLQHGAVIRHRRHTQDVREGELSIAVVGVFLQQLVQDYAGFGAILVEESLALRPAVAQTGHTDEHNPPANVHSNENKPDAKSLN